MNKLEQRKLLGFTLIELVVVISIITILVGSLFAVIRPQDFLSRSRDSRRQSDLKLIQTALEQYYANNNSYPSATPLAGSSWTYNGVTYLRSVPKDPNGNTNYCYNYNSPNYELCSKFEGPVPSGFSSPVACGANFNGCLTNPF
ncbi:MAG: prepilin-type N-terminal cleavage/methylation domain-containing protein [Patescibacteria group bacterium]|nr:prepilin-type N-terminal cleavage/methylation domain-containing protein [Patescibacteria group bacterium]